MKRICYTGPHREVTLRGSKTPAISGGAPVEVPDDIAEKLLRDAPQNWKLATATTKPATPAASES